MEVLHGEQCNVEKWHSRTVVTTIWLFVVGSLVDVTNDHGRVFCFVCARILNYNSVTHRSEMVIPSVFSTSDGICLHLGPHVDFSTLHGSPMDHTISPILEKK